MGIVEEAPRSFRVLVLPGGQVSSRAPSRCWQLARVRTALLTRGLRRRLGPDFVVEPVQYRYRGWNAPDLDPVTDADRALSAVPASSGPIILVGHSMGGRVAAHVAARHTIAGIVALAPWWPNDDAALIPAATRLRVLHGIDDSWTDPESSRRQTVSARDRGVDAEWSALTRAGHFMVRRWRVWHTRTTQLVLDVAERVPAARGER
ncbi:alpha/beta fold hydrolase [Nocardia sp. NPDC058058]|uniref:alpha/beta fold hydrolase n=1 Tax=Nocardia sp. NPDC058058 TaxID=3346317 RepID=UPI0036DF6D46